MLQNPPSRLSRFGCSVADAVQALPGMADLDNGQKAEPDQPKYKASGAWTAFSTWLILLVFAVISGGFSMMWAALIDFVTFDLTSLREIENSIPNLLAMLAAVIAINTPFMIAVGAWLEYHYGKAKSHLLAEMFTGIKRHNLNMTVTVVVEELLTRGLFLGVPWLVFGDKLPIVVYLGLFLLGNALWALVHLLNFANKRERQWGRVTPQFLSGIFFTIVFINFGLLGSIMVHLAFNYLLMSTMRKGTFNKGEVLVVLWHGFVAAISGVLLLAHFGKSLRDLGHWFDHDAQSFAIPGWEIQHYALAAIFIGSVLTIVADLLLFDLHPTQIEAAGLDGVGRAIFTMALAFVSFYGLEFFGVPFDVRVLIMALVFLLVRKSASGSGMARIFWIALPMLMFQLCAIMALGWNSAAWLIALAVAFIELPDRVLRTFDAKWESQGHETYMEPCLETAAPADARFTRRTSES